MWVLTTYVKTEPWTGVYISVKFYSNKTATCLQFLSKKRQVEMLIAIFVRTWKLNKREKWVWVENGWGDAGNMGKTVKKSDRGPAHTARQLSKVSTPPENPSCPSGAKSRVIPGVTWVRGPRSLCTLDNGWNLAVIIKLVWGWFMAKLSLNPSSVCPVLEKTFLLGTFKGLLEN